MNRYFCNFLIIILYFSAGKCSDEFENVDFLINTEKCQVPNLPPFSEAVNFKRNTSTVKCSNFEPLLTYTNVQGSKAVLYIREKAVAKYFGSPNSIKCCYSYVYRNGTDLLPDVGVVVTDCMEFSASTEIQHDLVWVSCRLADSQSQTIHGFPITPIYENIHQVIPLTDKVKEKGEKLQKSTTNKPISVLMIVIDSVSRLNFIRTMPQTRNFLFRNNFFEFKGYNKVADNTFPNAMAFLAGLDLKSSIEICRPTEVDGLINCPFIWNTFRDAGYATAYAEDWSGIATFNYFKKGFRDSPTDYYFKPYMDAITYLKTYWQDTMPFCAGPETQGDRVLNLAYDFAYNLRNIPSFGVFWMNTFSHNIITTPMTMDHRVAEFFENLYESKVLDESIVILLSDHGIRYGEILNTVRGFYELRLPMNYISLPKWFKQMYPTEARNFEENTGKLTSNYDLYMTLQHILVLSGTNHTIRPSSACPHCRSFFENIPTDRSCKEAGIPEKWCTCNVNVTEFNYI